MRERELERRLLARPVEFRAAADGKPGPGGLRGYAAAFGKLSQNLGGFVEEVDPAAFNMTLGVDARVLARYNHDDNYLLGTTEAETLRLGPVDEIGLPYDIDLPDTSAGRDCAVLAARGDLRYSSFAFYCIDDEWTVTPQGFPLRRLLQVQLVDVAPVNSPAYLDSSVAVRSFANALKDPITELREGKTLSSANQSLLQAALDALAKADERFDPIVDVMRDVDDALDLAQKNLADLLGVANPDAGDPPDDTTDDGTGNRSGRTGDEEQRDTHSDPRSIAALRMELGELQ